MATRKAQTPRGIRNKNPLNIRLTSAQWLGEVRPSQDTAFCQFVDVDHGIRAAFCIMRAYIEKYHIVKIPDIIERWAPSFQNNTAYYVEQVLRYGKLSANYPLDFGHRFQMSQLLYAMHIVECGREYFPLSRFTAVYDRFFLAKR